LPVWTTIACSRRLPTPLIVSCSTCSSSGRAAAFELDAALLQGYVLAHAVVGFDAEQRQAAAWRPTSAFCSLVFANSRFDAEFFVVWQAHQQPTVVVQLGIFSDFEAQLLV
jgi:hypothetical protein